jgi:hypothetical protein
MTGIYAFQTWLHLHRVRVAGFTRCGIIGDDTDMNIQDSTIENNSSLDPGAGIQFNNPSTPSLNAGIFMYRSTIANNTSSASGGGIYYSGFGVSNLYNVTISGNSAANGGGVFKDPLADYLFFYSSTVARNTATNSGGGISNSDVLARGVKLFQSIVGQNSASTKPDIDGAVNSLGNSLIGNTSGAAIGDEGGNLLNVSPNLDTVLRDLGGPFRTKVLRPFPGSPVIDVLSSPGEPEDQRQVLRAQFGGSNAAKADMGAFESSRLETETLAVAAKSSSVPHVVVSSSQYSNARGTNLQATAASRFVTYSTTLSLPPATYKVVLGYKKGSNAGRFQVAIAESLGGTYVPIGGVQEGYSSSSSWVSVELGNISMSANSAKFFRLSVTGKHTSSSSYQVFPDYVDFTRLD